MLPCFTKRNRSDFDPEKIVDIEIGNNYDAAEHTRRIIKLNILKKEKNNINWNLSEVKRLDIKVDGNTQHDIHHLYLPRSNGGEV